MAAKKKTVATPAPAVTAAPAVPGAVGLKAIVDATQAGSFVYTQPAEHAPLIEQGLVEINTQVATDPSGGIATRATPKGIESMTAQNSAPAATAAAATPKQKPSFKIDADIPIPSVIGRGRTGESMYPFDALEVGQSFFVEKAAKNLASTISSANQRYAEEVPGETRTTRKGEVVPKTKLTRQFVVRSVKENGTEGSRIWRKS